jgi:integrase
VGKRGNGEGSITRHKKSGLYMARYTIQTADGPKRKTIYGKKREDVADKLAKVLANRSDGLVYDDGNLTIEGYLTRWLKDSVQGTIRTSTFVRYKGIVVNHIVPALGNIKLAKLTSFHVRCLYRDKLDAGLSPRSVNYIHVTLHKALKQAVLDGLIPRNVSEAVRAPQMHRNEVTPLSPDRSGLSSRRPLATAWKLCGRSHCIPGSGGVRFWLSDGRTWISKPVGSPSGGA